MVSLFLFSRQGHLIHTYIKYINLAITCLGLDKGVGSIPDLDALVERTIKEVNTISILYILYFHMCIYYLDMNRIVRSVCLYFLLHESEGRNDILSQHQRYIHVGQMSILIFVTDNV